MMDTTSNELLRRKTVSEISMKGTPSDSATTFAASIGEKRKRENGDSCNTGNRGVVHNHRRGPNDNGDAERGEESVQSKKCFGPKFNDFDKLREEVNFAVGQTWALCDIADGMPRLYAQIRKVSAPSFRLRITYLEPDPDDEKEIRWFEEDLPVSVGNFRLGKNQNTKDRSIFSHVIQCNEGSNTGHFTVSPRKGEIWAMFKNWDINWSSDPDSHRKFEYEFVEILSDYADVAGVSVVLLHKAKGFASVFFRMGTRDAEISQILPRSLYRFSHRVPSFKLTGIEGRGVPKDAYELDQAALPDTVEEIIVPSHLLADPTASKSKPEALSFPRNGKVFQTGQIWSYYRGDYYLPLYYCRIKKITLTQAFEQAAEFKVHVTRLKATPFPEDVIQYKDKRWPVGCGTFLVAKGCEILTPDDFSHQIVPKTSMDGNEYTILPKLGDVWAIYRYWSHDIDVEALQKWYDYDIVEVLDDASDYKVLQLKFVYEKDKKTFFRGAESRHSDCDDATEAISTIPKSKRLKFSHQLLASRVTMEIEGELKELFEVDNKALCSINY